MKYVAKIASLAAAATLVASVSFAGELRTDPGPSSGAESFSEGFHRGLGGDTSDQSFTRGYNDGYASGRNEGFLEGYGVGTGMTPGPVEIPYSDVTTGGLGVGGGGGVNDLIKGNRPWNMN